MLDLQGVVLMKDDALDHQLQDSLPFGDADRLQAGTDAFAEGAQVRQSFAALSLFSHTGGGVVRAAAQGCAAARPGRDVVGTVR